VGWGAPQTVRATGSPVEAANVAAYRDAYAKFSAHDRAMFDVFAPEMIEVHVSVVRSIPFLNTFQQAMQLGLAG
jgi:hypothetical protein